MRSKTWSKYRLGVQIASVTDVLSKNEKSWLSCDSQTEHREPLIIIIVICNVSFLPSPTPRQLN